MVVCNMENLALLNLPDEILHMTVCGGMARVLLLRTTGMTRKAAQIHAPSDTATAAMSRLMTATAMLGCMMKGEDDSVTVTVAGNGPDVVVSTDSWNPVNYALRGAVLPLEGFEGFRPVRHVELYADDLKAVNGKDAQNVQLNMYRMEKNVKNVQLHHTNILRQNVKHVQKQYRIVIHVN